LGPIGLVPQILSRHSLIHGPMHLPLKPPVDLLHLLLRREPL